MWPLWLIIVIAVLGAAILTCTGILLAITLERRRHRHIMQAHGLGRGLSKYHRPKLSACEHNYVHVTHPTTPLRRSVQLPFGVVSIGIDSAGEDEEKQPNTAIGHADDYVEVLRLRSKRSIRRSFTGHPLYIPKTRRQGKLRKAVPLDRIQKSPLSAITEFSDPSTGVSPVAPEFPTESATTSTHEKTVAKPEQHISTQWPLAITSTRPSDIIPTEIMSIAVRESVLMRKGGGKHSQTAAVQLAAVPRSISAASMASSAPEDPLPPLPTILVPSNLKARASNASLDTVGSSVLGAFMSSPAKNATELNASNLDSNQQSPTFRLGLGQGFSTPKLQAPPAKQTIHGLCTSKPSIRSLYPTVYTDEVSPGDTGNISNPLPFPSVLLQEESFKVIDASNWDLPPLKVGKTRPPLGRLNRHSMIEQPRTAQRRAASDSATSLLADEDVFSVLEAPKRPNSVATGNPLKWDRQGSFAMKRHSLSALDGPKRGHRRQNCVRITNLPCLDLRANGMTWLPKLREEQQHLARTIEAGESFHSFDIRQPRSMSKLRQSEMDIKSSSTPMPSPFRNPPILTPTPRPVRKQYIQRPDSAVSGTPRPDSEVFNSSHMAMPVSNHRSPSPRQWPLSPCPGPDVLLRDTSPSTQPPERVPFESPILPSPALNSASLYPRKSLVKGPRNPRNSGQSSDAASASPLQNKTGSNYRITKARDSNGSGDFALRKSVMMLRSMDSEGRLLDGQSIKLSNVSEAEYESPEILAMPSPPMNKRVMGLRSTSCGSSTTSTPRSASTDRQQASRGSSPLARSTSNSSRQPQMKTTAQTSFNGCLDLPPPVMCVSPSVMSVSGGSIWEDVSVRGESPEPEVHVAPLALRPKADHNQQQYPSISTLQARRGEGFFETRSNGQYLLPDAPYVGVDTENSHLVQQLERVVSGGQWNHKTSIIADDDFYENMASIPHIASGQQDIDVFQLPNHSRKEIGLGLRLGNPTMRSTKQHDSMPDDN